MTRGVAPVLLFSLLILFLLGLFLLASLADAPVTFEDQNLELEIRQHLNHYSKPIFRNQLLDIHTLDLSDKSITDLSGIEHLRNLQALNLAHNHISDLSPLRTLRSLRSLDLQDNGIVDLDQVNFSNLSKLGLLELHLDNNRILTPEGVEMRLSNLATLSTFRTLETLSLSQNHIADIAPLQNLSQLTALDLIDNRINHLPQSSNWPELETLLLGGNHITDLQFTEGFGHLEKLETLDLSRNQIQDLAGIQHLSLLTQLEELDLSRNQIQDIASLAELDQLSKLNLRQNDLREITPLGNLPQLTYLNIHSNPNIHSVAPLANLININTLILRHVPVRDEVWVFSGMRNLQRLNINNCGISDYAFLGEMMASGILQDNPHDGVQANVNLRDNLLLQDGTDPLAPLRPYWENITFRDPYVLPQIAGLIESPQFSTNSGFFTEPFDLSLFSDSPDLEIYYTLDGSDPDPVFVDAAKSPYQKTHRYTQPITIRSRIGEADQYSILNTTHVENHIPWQPPADEVFKATVVRAITYDPQTRTQSPVVTHTFFVDEDIVSRYSTLPVISLTADYDALFAPESGILNTGADNNPFYHLETRVPANIEVFDPNSGMGLNGLYEIKLHGNTSVANPQKGFHVYAEPWLGAEAFEYPLFQDSASKANQLASFDRFIIRAWGTAFDWAVFFSDAYHQTLMADSSLDIQDYQPAILFINGEYWGLYEIREANKNTDYFQAHYFDGQEVPMDILELGTDDLIEAGTPADWTALQDYIESHDLSVPENYDYMQSKVDIENFVQYIIHCVFTGKKDWPTHNEAMWRSPALDGKWRWIQFDMDQGLRPGIDNFHDMVQHVTDETFLGHPLLLALLQNEEFEIYFLNTFADMLNTTFLTSVETAHFNEMAAQLEPYIPEYRQRWQIDSNWEQDKLEALELIMERWAFRKNQVLVNFEIAGTHQVTLISDQAMGTIQINSIVISSETPGVANPGQWSGAYFDGIPIQITALPKAGYRFVGWETNTDLERVNPTLTVMLTDDLQLEALFDMAD